MKADSPRGTIIMIFRQMFVTPLIIITAILTFSFPLCTPGTMYTFCSTGTRGRVVSYIPSISKPMHRAQGKGGLRVLHRRV